MIGCASLDTNPKRRACRAGCDSAYDDCKKEAKDDTTEVAKCEAQKIACNKGCDKM